MPIKGSGSADLTVIHQTDDSVGWFAYPDEAMRRASHAVVSDDDLWIIDPVDADGVDDLLEEYGSVSGVLVLLDRHTRDAETFANRHDVSVWVPAWMDDVAADIDAPVKRFTDGVAGFEVDRLLNNRLWQEAVLYDGETLVVPEALGTVPYFLADDERLGVHPFLRPFPPRSVQSYEPDTLLVGHGRGVTEDVQKAITQAISGSRGNMLSLYWKNLVQFLRSG